MEPRYRPNHELRRQRKLRGWTLEEAAEHLHGEAIASGESGVGCDANSISRYERGLRVPGPRYTRLLCRMYELPADRLGLVPPIETGAEWRLGMLSDAGQLASLAGAGGPRSSSAEQVIDLALEILIDIGEDGWAQVVHRQELLNLTSRPVVRLVRELWFEHTSGPLAITPVDQGGRRVVIQRLYDVGNVVEFACQISPPVQPGESAEVRFACEGGRFVSNHYWRQMLPRFTRRLVISVRHRGGRRLATYSAHQQRPDGSENSITDGVMWSCENTDVIITLVREELDANQVVTLRWDVNHGPP